jgi:hypothetical protein
MFLLPFRQTEITSPHSPDTLAERLREHTSSRHPWWSFPSGSGSEFIGSISATEFRLMPAFRGRNTYQPWLVGHVSPCLDGSTIRLTETFQPIQIAIIISIYVLPPIVAIVTDGINTALCILLSIIFFHSIMYFVGFLPEARRAEARIRQLVA